MLLIAVYYRRCGRNLRAKLDTAINSLSANHAYLKSFYWKWGGGHMCALGPLEASALGDKTSSPYGKVRGHICDNWKYSGASWVGFKISILKRGAWLICTSHLLSSRQLCECPVSAEVSFLVVFMSCLRSHFQLRVFHVCRFSSDRSTIQLVRTFLAFRSTASRALVVEFAAVATFVPDFRCELWSLIVRCYGPVQSQTQSSASRAPLNEFKKAVDPTQLIT